MNLLPQENLLARESSPYLRQHQHNPVNWRAWSRAALDEAAELQKPILLSIGYAACHWCHVMAHESFEDEQVATVMNRLFVNIKVDREERPDIDQIYMAALTSMGEQGGWPLTMFLMPDGKPFWGGTYFPREPKYGRPGFIQVLEAVSRSYEEKQVEIIKSADALSQHVQLQLSPEGNQTEIDKDRLSQLANTIFNSMDKERGGLRGAPKFPNAPFMNALWLNWQRTKNDDHRTALIDSLYSMLSGGIYDHLGGGLCRYSTDALWLVPHFEKMLYDNAQLISHATYAYAETNDELFRIRIEETIHWLCREMLLPSGAFASSLNADSDGEEGSFYVWQQQQIIEAIGEKDASQFFSIYELSKPDEWEGSPILHRLSSPHLHEGDISDTIQNIKTALFEARDKREKPTRDDKILIDWNGLAIEAIADAARVFGRNEWIDLAAKAFDFIVESEREGRLPHSILDSDMLFPCLSSDYAAMINAAISLAMATKDKSYLVHAQRWMGVLNTWHTDDTNTGYYLTASDASDVPMRIRGDFDEATPSATSQILRAMARLSTIDGDTQLYEKAYTSAQHALGRIENKRFGIAGIITASEIVREPKKLIIVDNDKEELVKLANSRPDMSRIDIHLMQGTSADEINHPGEVVIDTSKTGGWLCIGQSCLPPVRNTQLLSEIL